jgi:tetratricopeptide (TPR) repeat protein
MTLWSGHIAQRESKYAQRQRSLAVSSAQTMIDDFATALETLSAPTKPRLELLKKVAGVFDQLEETRDLRDRFATEQGIAEAQGSIHATLRIADTLVDLGDRNAAMGRIRSAEELALELQKKRARDERGNLLLAEVLIAKGQLLKDESNIEEAEIDADVALRNLRVLDSQKDQAFGKTIEIMLCRALTLQGSLLFDTTSFDEAERVLKQAIEDGERIYRQSPDDADAVDAYASALQGLGWLYNRAYREDLVREPIERSLSVRRLAVEKSARNARLRLQLDSASAIWNHAIVRRSDGDGRIRESFDQSIEKLRKRSGEDPDNFDLRVRLMTALFSYGTYVMYYSDAQSAIPLFSETLRLGIALHNQRKNDRSLDDALFQCKVRGRRSIS